MRIDKTDLDTHAVLTLRGEFETFHCPRLLEEVDRLLARGVTRAVLNLRLVKFINSTALGSIIRAHKRFRADGGDMVIAKPSPFCREAFRKIGIDRVVRMFDDEEAAAAHLMAIAPPEGVAAEIDDTNVIFTFPDDRAKLLKGRRKGHGVATVSNVDAETISFAWDSSKLGVSDAQLDAMFARGSRLHTKFQVKLIKKGFFELDASVRDVNKREDGTVKVTAEWSGISESDRTALAQFANDMAYLKRQVPDA